MTSKINFSRAMYFKPFAFSLFRDDSIGGGNRNYDLNVERFVDETVDYSRIRCPKCEWQPTAASRWFCADADFPEFYFNGCGTMWNTFATGGVCPGCAHRWRWTSCLSCYGCSRHKDWYVEKQD